MNTSEVPVERVTISLGTLQQYLGRSDLGKEEIFSLSIGNEILPSCKD